MNANAKWKVTTNQIQELGASVLRHIELRGGNIG
jgi:hypothetical protein